MLQDEPGPEPKEGLVKPEEQEVVRKYPKHPVTIFFHLIFKLGALFSYLFLIYILGEDNFIITFITVIICCAADFWTTKNVTGRLLVGMRWWNEVKEDGSSAWIFESLENKSNINPTEVMIFWGALLIYPILWGVFFVTSFLGLHWTWTFVTVVALVLACANITGYIKCARDSRSRLNKYAKSRFTEYIFSSAFGGGSEPSQPRETA